MPAKKIEATALELALKNIRQNEEKIAMLLNEIQALKIELEMERMSTKVEEPAAAPIGPTPVLETESTPPPTPVLEPQPEPTHVPAAPKPNPLLVRRRHIS
jgi:hypothetical protein